MNETMQCCVVCMVWGSGSGFDHELGSSGTGGLETGIKTLVNFRLFLLLFQIENVTVVTEHVAILIASGNNDDM